MTKKQLKDFIKSVVESDFDGCRYSETDVGGAYIVATKDAGGTTRIKIAVNCDDLQCDYDWDWEAPKCEDGEAFDAEFCVLKDDFYLEKNPSAFYGDLAKYFSCRLDELKEADER